MVTYLVCTYIACLGSDAQHCSPAVKPVSAVCANPFGGVAVLSEAAPTSFSIANGIAVASNGDVILSGYFGGSLADEDIAVVRLASNGTLLWSVSWGRKQGVTVADEAAAGLALDSNGDIVVAGYKNSFGAGAYDIVVLRLSGNGTLLWAVTWGGPANDEAAAVAVSGNGDIVVVGSTASSGLGTEAVVVYLTSNGTLVWAESWDSPNTESENAVGVTVADNGDVVAVGVVTPTGDTRSDVAVWWMSSNGTLLWSATWGGIAADGDCQWQSAVGVVFAQNGDLVIVGSCGSAFNTYMAMWRLASNGTLLWSGVWAGVDGKILQVNLNGVTVANNGDILVAGTASSIQVANDFDGLVCRFSGSDGSLLQSWVWGGPSFDVFNGVATKMTPFDHHDDGSVRVTVAGYTRSVGEGDRNFVVWEVGNRTGAVDDTCTFGPSFSVVDATVLFQFSATLAKASCAQFNLSGGNGSAAYVRRLPVPPSSEGGTFLPDADSESNNSSLLQPRSLIQHSAGLVIAWDSNSPWPGPAANSTQASTSSTTIGSAAPPPSHSLASSVTLQVLVLSHSTTMQCCQCFCVWLHRRDHRVTRSPSRPGRAAGVPADGTATRMTTRMPLAVPNLAAQCTSSSISEST